MNEIMLRKYIVYRSYPNFICQPKNEGYTLALYLEKRITKKQSCDH